MAMNWFCCSLQFPVLQNEKYCNEDAPHGLHRNSICTHIDCRLTYHGNNYTHKPLTLTLASLYCYKLLPLN